MTEVDRAFGTWLADRRSEGEMTQAALGKVLGLNQSGVSKMERGQRPVLLAEAVKVARLFGEALPDWQSLVSDVCRECLGSPPHGFTCNACGTRAA